MSNTGIDTLLRHMQDSARELEKEGSEIFETRLSNDFFRFAELAKLFLISERDSYYGYVLMNMSFEVDFEQEIIAGIKLDSFPPVFISNPLLLSQFELKEILYIFCHEIDHVVYRHPIEMSRIDKANWKKASLLFNLAADASVNDMLNYEIERGCKFLQAPRGVVTSRYLAERYGIEWLLPRQSYRYYFDTLMQTDIQIDERESRIAPLPHGLPSRLQSNDTYSDDNEDVIREHDDEITERDHRWISNSLFDEDVLASSLKKLLNDSYSAMDGEVKSLMPHRFIDQIVKINEPAQIPWQSMLKRYVGTVSAGRQKTHRRLNRRQPFRYDLAGSIEEKTLNLVVAIDTSASISQSDLKYIFNEIFAILRHKKYGLTIIECDSEIENVYQARSIADIDLSAHGRGGTAFTPVIEYVNERRDLRGSLLVYFTDGLGEKHIPQPRSYKMLWVILDDEKNLSLEEPYGAVLPLKTKNGA